LHSTVRTFAEVDLAWFCELPHENIANRRAYTGSEGTRGGGGVILFYLVHETIFHRLLRVEPCGFVFQFTPRLLIQSAVGG